MAKKIWELMQEDIERNKQASENLQREANEKFNNLVSKKGTYDTSKHTYRMNDLKQNASKEYYNSFKKANKLTLWDTIKDFANNSSYVAKKTSSGALSGITGIAQGKLTDSANNMSKGKKMNNAETIQSMIKFLSPNIGKIMDSVESGNKTIEILKDKDKNAWQKISEIGLNSVEGLKKQTDISNIDEVEKIAGKVNANADKTLMEINSKISEPAKRYNELLQEESENYGDTVKFLGDVGYSIGNMSPSIIASAVTKDPSVGLTTMGMSVKGQATQDALNKGQDLETAVKIGDAKALVEVATEKLAGGLGVFGKGSVDDIAEEFIKKGSKSTLGRFLLKQGYNISGEVTEEEISNIINNIIDKGTTEPDKKIFDIKEALDTAKTTAVTTGILNGITGGYANDYNQARDSVVNSQYKDYNTNKTLDNDIQNQLRKAENIINQNQTTNLQPQSTQTQQILPTQQINQQENKVVQNRNTEQVKVDSENFAKQIDKVKKGTFPKNDMLVLGNTPQVLKDIGLKDLPITMTQKHLDTIMNESGKHKGANYHGLGEEIVKQLPQAINNPLDIVKSNTKDDSIVLTTYLADKQNRTVIASIKIDGKGTVNDIRIDTNVMTSAYGRNNYEKFMEENIKNGNLLYDIDRGVIKKVTGARLQLPRTSNSSIGARLQLPRRDASINNIIPQNNQNMQVQQEISKEAYIHLPQNAKKTLNPTEISNITIEDVDTTPILPTKNYKKGNKESSFFSNIVTDAQFLEKDLRQEIGKDENIRYYKGVTNQETLEKAYNSLNEEGKTATLNWFNKDSKDISAEDVAKGWILLKQYQDSGDYQSAVEVAKKMRDMGTRAGQAVQTYNILSRLTPEGMFYYAQSELSEAYNKMVQGKSKKWIEENQSKFDLTPEEAQFIMDNMNEVANMEDGYDKKVKIAEIQKIVSDKIPPTMGQSIKSWMRISMLFNPKTQVRNIAGNAVILPVNISSDIISSGIDKVISKKTGVRTTGNINLKNYGKGFGKGLYESYNDFRKGINTRNIEGNRFEVNEGKNFKDKGIGKALNRVDNILSFALDAGDRGFYEATFTNSINNQLVLNNTTEVTQDMVDIATNEALQRTWQDNNKYTEAVLKIRKILNSANVKGYGLGDVLIPFAKTPANLTKAIIDYSPAGLVKAMTLDARTFKNSLENGQFTPQMQHKFVQNLGKGMAGSFLYILGYALAKAGIASGEADDDKDVKNFMKNSLGISSYSLKIGNKTFTYDWAQPVATPLAIMTNYVKYSKDNPDANILEKGIKSLNIGTEQLLQQSFMESLNTVLNGNGTTLENLSQAVLELPARAVPTFSKQIADMLDETQRTSFEYDQPIKSAVNSVIAKVPVASKSLPVSRDTLGNEIKKYGGENNIWNVMFNPANVNKGELSKAGEEIYRLYQETGETTVFPITAPYYINTNGEKITMTAEERSNYQKVTGKYTEKAIEELLSNSAYKELSNDKKAELITDIISDSNSKAKHDILDIETEDAKKKRELIEKVGTKNYYDYRLKTKDIEGENTSLRKNEILLDANYSASAKEVLYVNTTGKEDKIYNILKDIDIDEYLDYKIKESKEEFSADKDSNGNSISGTSKKKYYNYINSNITDVGSRLIILGSKYKLSTSERYQLSDYINKISSNNEEAIQTFEYLSKNYVVKDGKVYYK